MNEYPRGKLCEDDEGAIGVHILSEGEVVKIVFASPVAWFAMDKKQAQAFAFCILRASGVQIQEITEKDRDSYVT